MADLSYPLAFVGGIATHLLYFNRGEHHMNGILYLFTTLSVTVAATVVLYTQYGHGLYAASKLAGSVLGAFLVGLYSSLFLYRGFFNPLNKFPGPYLARFSSFWWSVHNIPDSHAFLKNQALHDKYGPFVRIGPNMLSIIHKDAPELLYGNKSKCRKGEWYATSHLFVITSCV
jgi:tryprostatin B 6-hydroxylase